MTLTGAWQAALAAEHQAVFAYGLLGPRLSGAASDLARTCAEAHATLRDTTEQSLAAAGATPVGARADYPALYPVDGPAAALRVAVRVEDDCAAAWRYLYAVAAAGSGSASSATRRAAQDALTASAVRGVQWRSRIDPARASTPFPGI